MNNFQRYMVNKVIEYLVTDELKREILQDNMVSPFGKQILLVFINACSVYKTASEFTGMRW